jgi:hypothetical protein
MKLTLTVLAALCLPAFADDVIPAGTNIAVRTNDPIRAKGNTDEGRIYTGTVANDVADDRGQVIVPRGADAELVVRRLKSNELVIDLDSVSVHGHRYAIVAEENVEKNRNGVGGNKRTGEFVGGGAVLGTLLGAIAGGGKGAAIGAAAGAGAGAGTQMLTRGRSLNVPAESVLTFRLEQPIHVDVPDRGRDRDGHHYHQ